MNTIDKAIMYKEGNTLQKRVEDLNKEIKTATKEEKIFIEKDIKKYEYAIKGENKIINALMNSNIPMLILHDLNIAYKDYKAQIDFMIITKRNYYILECKNTYGNILVDSNGNFFRTYYGKKVGIYNPIDKLDRNIDIIKAYLYDHSDFLEKLILNKSYDNFYHGVVVLSNENVVTFASELFSTISSFFELSSKSKFTFLSKQIIANLALISSKEYFDLFSRITSINEFKSFTVASL